jgi:thiol-disulfide isomerase/thioredoxin
MKIRTFFPAIAITFASLLLINSCTQKPKSIIEGEIINLDQQAKISLLVEEFKSSKEIGKTDVSPKKGGFKFNLGELSEPTLASISIQGKKTGKILLLLEPNEKVKVTIDFKSLANYSVEGSLGSEQVQVLTKRISFTKKTLDSLNNQISKATDNISKERLMAQYNAAIDSQRVFSTRFIWANPMSRASVVALYQQYAPEKYVFDRAEDIQLFKVVASSIIARFPNSSYAKGMEQDIAEMNQKVKSYHVLNLLKQAEATLPEIALPNTNGDTVKLSSLKGKVIIINFWASWNQASLLENRELAGIYNQFKGKPVIIFNVSLDVDKQAWLKAIETTNAPGVHVCEFNAKNPVSAGSYNVTEIPTNFVIDKNYDIIGRNVRGEALKRMIQELL